jgi:glycosyltransferase involved in cell wall biosynthesis
MSDASALESPRARLAGTTPVPVSVMIFTLDEAVHLPSCLDAARWCDDVIVVDSFSTDATEAICRARGVRFFQHPFTGFGAQRNWALDNTHPKHDWILILDADERITTELADEMRVVLESVPDDVGAFRLKRRFHMWGRWLRYSSLYPTWVVRLIHRDRVRYIDRGHAETQEVQGRVLELEYDLIDENLKGNDVWFARQNSYARREAEHELREEARGWSWRQIIRGDPLERRDALKRLAWRMPARPLIYFLYAYIVRQGFRDGMDGLHFCAMKAIYQAMIVTKKYDIRRMARAGAPPSA